MASDRQSLNQAIADRAEQLVRETGTTRDWAEELAAMELNPNYSDTGQPLPTGDVVARVKAIVASAKAQREAAAAKPMAAD